MHGGADIGAHPGIDLRIALLCGPGRDLPCHQPGGRRGREEAAYEFDDVAQTITVGYAYPAVWLLPLVFLVLVPVATKALTRDLDVT